MKKRTKPSETEERRESREIRRRQSTALGASLLAYEQ